MLISSRKKYSTKHLKFVLRLQHKEHINYQISPKGYHINMMPSEVIEKHAVKWFPIAFVVFLIENCS